MAISHPRQRGRPTWGEGIVFLGLGNFVSGQLAEPRTVLGGAVALRIEKRRPAGGGRAQTRVVACGPVPLVCHADAATGRVTECFLDDYTDELARAGEPLTVAALHALAPTPCRLRPPQGS